MHEMVLYYKLHARLAKKNIGMAPATCTKATAIGFVERLVTNHPAPTRASRYQYLMRCSRSIASERRNGVEGSRQMQLGPMSRYQNAKQEHPKAPQKP